ncbi:S phase cyclin A-associated protein in the endoplasmic reticulum-like isoform X2 [Mizuhopecten yessoensis]|uniref:S phase cyclin A-associated protein in the endoplasmic reticulum-like isoform X2 n=1 Tax=Mizuhopecten yessoensis TaxID=6573 RepID=UPI000B457C29|nr:S phase cyclin A-associated protein in the endoplasmic reticulum-like isoform X2 [Mizuhopecten yessoensis]
MSETKRKRHGVGGRMRSENGENFHHRNPGSSSHHSRGGRNNSQTSGHYNRMNSYDRVRKIVQEEGRTARNLVIYNVPVEQENRAGANLPAGQQAIHMGRMGARKHPLKDQNRHRNVTPPKRKAADDYALMQKSQQELLKSPKSDSGLRKPDLRARYWKFLFDNLQRAVDAIYETCEQDESVVECKEVIMMLEQSTRDFKSLIERLHMLRAFEESAKEGDRPTSIAWEVRKMSPGKSAGTQGHGRSTSSPSPAQRVLTFPDQRSELGHSSWADKVKGKVAASCSADVPEVVSPTSTLPLPPPPVTQNGISASEPDTDGSNTIEDDNDGWETVQRGSKCKARQSPSQRSLENLTGVGQNLGRKNLKRTLSDPHASKTGHGQTKMEKSPLAKKSVAGGNKSPLSKKSVAGGNQNNGTRQRTDSKDSEKENRPSESRRQIASSQSDLSVSQSGRTSGARVSPTLKKSLPSVSRSSPNISGVSRSSEPTVGTKMSYSGSVTKGSSPAPARGRSTTKKDMKKSQSLDLKVEDSSVILSKVMEKGETDSLLVIKCADSPIDSKLKGTDSQGSHVQGASSDGLRQGEVPVNQETKGDDEERLDLESQEKDQQQDEEEKDRQQDEEEKDRQQDEEDDAYAAQLDSALATALEEEDTLTRELEEEQEQALESAIQEEETWLKALAQEQNSVIEVETETESDLGVSLVKLNCVTEVQTETESDLGVSLVKSNSVIEVQTETESDLGNTMSSLEASGQTLDWDILCAQYDEAEGKPKMSWGEIVDDAETRTPGHGVHMHEKLSSPSRRRSPTESRKRHEEKQAKARELREKFMHEKSERLGELSKKVEEVRAWKEELMRQRKGTIQSKMTRAEEKRHLQLRMKAQKAHEEEAKANEIAFINALDAQNKRHDIMSKHQESEARLHTMEEERQRKHVEKLAKESAVEERRRALYAERQAKLKDMEERRKQRDARVEHQQQEKEKERLEALRIREKEREERLAALNAQQQAHIQELQKKIQQKQDESTQRHQEALQQIREKAFEMTVQRLSSEDHNEPPNIAPYDTKKLCTICNVLIPSEVHLLSHLRGKKHQQALQDNNSGKTMTKQEIETFNLKHIVDAPTNSTHPKIVSEKERLKSLKKRCKKLRQRMITRGLEYENSLTGKITNADSTHKAKLQKVVRDINKYLQAPDTGPWPQNKVSALDRALGEISRILDKKVAADQTSIRILGGLTCLGRILQTVDVNAFHLPSVLPPKSLVLTCSVFRQACKGCYDNCHYMLFSNKLGTVIDLLIHRLTILLPEEQKRPASGYSGTNLSSSSSGPSKLPCDLVAVSLMQLLSSILNCLAKYGPTAKCSEAAAERMSSSGDPFTIRGNDVISYIISVGIVDKLTQYFRGVQGPIDEDKEGAEFLQHSLGLLVSMTKIMSKRNTSLFDQRKVEDPTQLINTYEMTELVGIVSLLYGMLLHSGAPSRSDSSPPEFPQHTMAVALTGLRMLNNMATLDLHMLQKTLGDEGMSLEFRHIASYLMWYCSHHTSDDILHEVIQCVGYFTVLCPDNQVVIQSGQPPTILQQMCSLPFKYFSDPRLTNVLFPTLISSCYNNQSNRQILEQELSCMLLSNFIEEKQLEVLQAKLHPSKKEKEKIKDLEHPRMQTASRFPMEQWMAAQEYFKIS